MLICMVVRIVDFSCFNLFIGFFKFLSNKNTWDFISDVKVFVNSRDSRVLICSRSKCVKKSEYASKSVFSG